MLLTLRPLAPGRLDLARRLADQVGEVVVNCEDRGSTVFHNFTGAGARFGLKKRGDWLLTAPHSGKNPPGVGGKMCVAWSCLVGSGILRFLKSSGMQACLQTFGGLL